MRALRSLSSVLIVAGCLLLADAGLTLLWQEPVSAIYAVYQQRRLDSQLAAAGGQGLSRAERRSLNRLPSQSQRVAFLARKFRRDVRGGDALGRIDIPRIGVDKVFVEGTVTADLRKGPGRYPDTSFPGLPGTTAIAGHRTTYGAPFRRINRLKRGDAIVLSLPYAVLRYRVQGTRIVQPTALWVTRDRGYGRLVLSACHPLYSAAKRIIVFARLVSARPRGVGKVG